jgi:hypothetical protein
VHHFKDADLIKKSQARRLDIVVEPLINDKLELQMHGLLEKKHLILTLVVA